MTVQSGQKGQESLYGFPYHHLVDFDDQSGRGFRSGRWYPGALRYASYLLAVSKTVAEEPFDSLVDIGCGDGRLTGKLAERFEGQKVVGVDVATNALQLARCISGRPNVSFVECDITQRAPEGAPFDCGTMVEVLEHIPLDQVEAFVSGVGRLIRPGGRLIVTVPSTNMNLKNITRHHQHFTQETLKAALAADFEPVGVRHVNRRGKVPRWMQKVVSNKLFALTHERALDFVFQQYNDWFFEADEKTGLRVFGVFRRRE